MVNSNASKKSSIKKQIDYNKIEIADENNIILKSPGHLNNQFQLMQENKTKERPQTSK
jgi:hypothetical protein